MLLVFARGAETVNAGHRGDNYDILSLEQRSGGTKPQAINVFIHRSVFFNVRICGGNISLRLVVIVVTDEKLDGVPRKKGL